MGKAPYCDKHGVRKGAWTPKEDEALVEYIKKHGHGSWRTFPKQAVLPMSYVSVWYSACGYRKDTAHLPLDTTTTQQPKYGRKMHCLRSYTQWKSHLATAT